MFSSKITSFEWDKGNIAHLLEHDVDPEEVEEAFAPENLFHIVNIEQLNIMVLVKQLQVDTCI